MFLFGPFKCSYLPFQVMDTYCWIHSTFSIPSRVKGLEGRDIAHAGVAPNSDLEEGQQVQDWILGSGCGTVGRAVASDTRDPKFESSHLQFLCSLKCIEQMKIKKKRQGIVRFFKKIESGKKVNGPVLVVDVIKLFWCNEGF